MSLNDIYRNSSLTHRVSRRSFVKMLAATLPAVELSTNAQKPIMDSSEAILRLKRSRSFGITEAGGWLGRNHSLYSLATEHRSALTFDVSNNQIAASFSPSGTLRQACVASGLQQLPETKLKGGVYSTKRLLYGGPWELQPVVDGSAVLDGDKSVSLIENLLPMFVTSRNELTIHHLPFAPITRRNPKISPRTLLNFYIFKNESAQPQRVQLVASRSAGVSLETDSSSNLDSGQAQDLSHVESTHGRVQVARLSSRGRAIPTSDDGAIDVPAHSSRSVVYLWSLTENELEFRAVLEQLSTKSPYEWLEDTLLSRTQAYGRLEIPEDPFFAESLIRSAELARQTALRLSSGDVCGGFLGSDVDENQVNWVRDSYYAMLAMSLFDPKLCRDSIAYLMKWGPSPAVTGPSLARFPGAEPISQSLSNSVSGLCLAGAYYRSTGDHAFFRNHPEFLIRAGDILGRVLKSRRHSPMLFPSLYFSDGEARGDFHTGSNISAWYAFSSMARIAREVYKTASRAEDWQGTADEIQKSIEKDCVGQSEHGARFFEGSNADGTFVMGHDGEESETTLLPFYDYCAADDTRLRTHAALALTKDNPLYSKELDAIWWYNRDWSSATFPSWITGLASAGTQQDIRYRLERIRSLTDLDGSFWLWPYRYGSEDLARPLRGDVAKKCGWGGGIYACRFVHDVLGISADAPSASFEFAPFLPWKQFTWHGLRLGNSHFDVHYRNDERETYISIRSWNSRPFSVCTIIVAEQGQTLDDLQVVGGGALHTSRSSRWSRPALRAQVRLGHGETVTLLAPKTT